MTTGRSERYTTRPFVIGAFAFTVTTATEADRRVVESLFQDMPAPTTVDASITPFSLIPRDSDTGGWVVRGRELLDVEMETLGGALNLLMGQINAGALDSDPEHLHVHAALATNEGAAVIIAAERHVGKTTTVAHLVARGFAFVTDEMVQLSPHTDKATGFRKPISIKPGGSEVLGHLEPWMVPSPNGSAPSHDFSFVSMGATGATVVDGGRPHLAVILMRPTGPEEGAHAEELHPADAVVALMQQTQDAERFGPAVVQLAKLAASTRCVDLTTGTPTETADAIEALFRLDAPEPVDVAVHPASEAFSPGVVSVGLGDRAVIHNTNTGRIFALDPGGTRVWSKLGGWSEDPIDVDGPMMRPFVAQLRAFGLLGSAA
jgi:hypothetical protein